MFLNTKKNQSFCVNKTTARFRLLQSFFVCQDFFVYSSVLQGLLHQLFKTTAQSEEILQK